MKKLKNKQTMYIALAILVVVAIVLVYFQLGSRGSVTTDEGEELNTCGEGTIIYTDDELCWQRSVMPERADDYQEATDYCKNLELAGETDWRLPTSEELAGIVDDSFSGVAIDTKYFQDTEAINYWTSSMYRTNIHWYVHFELGYQGFAQDYRDGFGVRCVRENTLF